MVLCAGRGKPEYGISQDASRNERMSELRRQQYDIAKHPHDDVIEQKPRLPSAGAIRVSTKAYAVCGAFDFVCRI